VPRRALKGFVAVNPLTLLQHNDLEKCDPLAQPLGGEKRVNGLRRN
jgi:hypothetical protein